VGDYSSIQCIILFEEPFWVAVFERRDECGYAAARTVFGAEPTMPDVHDFILKNYFRLSFSQPLADAPPALATTGFKRAQRENRRAAAQKGTSTRAQEALRLERESHKITRQAETKAEREAERERRFQLRVEHKKEKKRGH
jgi:hypothetical protein